MCLFGVGCQLLDSSSRTGSSLWPLPGCAGLGAEKGLTECPETLAHGHRVSEQRGQGWNPGPLSPCPGLFPPSSEEQPRVGGSGWRTAPPGGSRRPEDITCLISGLCLIRGGRIKLFTAHVLYLPTRHGLEIKNERHEIQSSSVQRLAGRGGGGTARGSAHLIFIGS